MRSKRMNGLGKAGVFLVGFSAEWRLLSMGAPADRPGIAIRGEKKLRERD